MGDRGRNWSSTGPEKIGFLLETWEGGPDGYEDWQFLKKIVGSFRLFFPIFRGRLWPLKVGPLEARFFNNICFVTIGPFRKIVGQILFFRFGRGYLGPMKGLVPHL